MPSSIRTTIVFAAAALAFAACSSTASVGKYPDGSTSTADARTKVGDATPSGLCLAFGQTCVSGGDCCSGLCDPASATCVASINKCTTTGGACASSTECCSLACSAGRCSASACLADNLACIDSASCCGGNCSAGLCQPLNNACHTAGNPCTDNTQCCSSLCEAGTCKLGASFCIQTGDVCSDSSTCCSGDCQKGTGTLGTCASPPSGATYCSDGVDGTVCGACNGCCSRLCAPYAPTGVRICQPASGCRVNGDLCRKDSDCCGAAGTGLPGDGNVVCEIDAGKALGICRNPRSCNPQGNVCHFKNYTCSVSSARNDCCAGVGNSGVCQLDMLGVPRCNGLGTTCLQGGAFCSSAMDCCNQMPCVPDGTGFATKPGLAVKMIERAIAAFPNFKAVATTLRHVKTASINDWAAVLYTDGTLHRSRDYHDLEIWDRVGGGDSFASGLVYGLLAGKGPQWAVECGAAHGALAMTTPGDTTMASLAEVERVMKGAAARVAR